MEQTNCCTESAQAVGRRWVVCSEPNEPAHANESAGAKAAAMHVLAVALKGDVLVVWEGTASVGTWKRAAAQVWRS